jgi:hypothetical protein
MLIYKKVTTPNFHLYQTTRMVSLYLDGMKRGDCCLTGLSEDNTECLFSGNVCSLTISIDKEYQQLEYSREMWRMLVKQIEEEYPDFPRDKMFFIDADASLGYWDYMGFMLNRYGYDYKGKRELEGRGYEKVITFQTLKNFLN